MLEKLTGKAYAPESTIRDWADAEIARASADAAARAWGAARKRATAKAKKPEPPPPLYFTDKLKLAMKVRQRFPIGTTVYYNAPGWDTNSMGTVTGYKAAGVKVRVWFDFLGETVEIHACSRRGWHLSLKPLTGKAAEKMQKRGVVWE